MVQCFVFAGNLLVILLPSFFKKYSIKLIFVFGPFLSKGLTANK